MLISYNWLRELVRFELSPRELAERLTMIGLAVDTVREAGDDYILEFDLTSNRPDCLSHLGVAREVAALVGARVHLPEAKIPSLRGRAGELISVEIEEPDLCPRYTARIVRNVRIAPSPEWLADRLQKIGQRPINNVTDITNYVLHEQGQPLHAFDLDRLRGRKIIVRCARRGERILTLDGVERELAAQMLVIADAERPVAIAGVMGGEEASIHETTRNVLIESAYFDPLTVRRTARALDLHTESSHRFERGADPEAALRAQERAIALICEIAGGEATEDALDLYPRPIVRPVVALRPSRVEALTGVAVPEEDIIRILTALGFHLKDGERIEVAAAEQPLRFITPSWRVDIEREEDLVEEVARHRGYEKIPEELPASKNVGEYLYGEERRRTARRALAALGFDEAISFSFINSAYEHGFAPLPTLGGDEVEFVKVSNPIIEGVTLMRASLVPGLLEAVRHNFNHGTRDVRLFELGRVFARDPHGERPRERESLGLVATGGALEEGRALAQRALDFYDVKGALEAASEAMEAPRLEFEEARVAHLREGQAALVRLNGRAIGYIGRLAESVAAQFKFKQPVYVAEIDLTSLLEAEARKVRYAPLPRYPAIVRDLSIIIERRISWAAIRRAVLALGLAYLRSVEFADVYEGQGVPEGHRSLTLRLEYRADDRTLRDDEVDRMHEVIVRKLKDEFGAQLRQ